MAYSELKIIVSKSRHCFLVEILHHDNIIKKYEGNAIYYEYEH